jgi:hypothetical protein
MSKEKLIHETKVDILVALSLWMDYDTALNILKGYENEEKYEHCAAMWDALQMHAGATLNCRIGNIYYNDER